MSTPTIAVLHGLSATSRHAGVDHVLCFERYLSNARVIYQHVHQDPARLHEFGPIDLVVMNWCFLARRKRDEWAQQAHRYEMLRELECPIVAIPQDDYKCHDTLDAWLQEIGVSVVWSPIERNLEVLYPRTLPIAEFRLQLTGYVEDARVEAASQHIVPLRERKLDVGQRVRFATPSLGRHAQKKGRQAVAFGDALRGTNFAVDISTDPADAFHGDDWFRFLGSARFIIGCKGGASIPDRDGSIRDCERRFLEEHPHASFEEVEAACFPGLDGRFEFAAIGPRLFDAAATRTAQILTPDDYLGVLEPWIHYIPLEEDFSNIDEVFAAMRDLERAQEIADACYDALIGSGSFTYAAFARDVVEPLGTGSLNITSGESLVERLSDPLTESLMKLPRKVGAKTFDDIRRSLRVVHARGAAEPFARAVELARVGGFSSASILDAEPRLHALGSLAEPAAELAVLVAHSSLVDEVARWLDAARSGRMHGHELERWIDPPLLDTPTTQLGRRPTVGTERR